MVDQTAKEQRACDKLAKVFFRTGVATFAVGLLYGIVLNGPNLWVSFLS